MKTTEYFLLDRQGKINAVCMQAIWINTFMTCGKKGKREGYLRFLNSLAESISVTYSKPASIN